MISSPPAQRRSRSTRCRYCEKLLSDSKSRAVHENSMYVFICISALSHPDSNISLTDIRDIVNSPAGTAPKFSSPNPADLAATGGIVAGVLVPLFRTSGTRQALEACVYLYALLPAIYGS
ncbi:hypothetical protein FRC04_000730 [Tulasnella sp. 424]|nr:hypothetical protein FRC04_000730 [Tulasnella sp. 424]KAG8968580.1 hypothetical protein FRC05_001505 [Tulasnella sp. 425]